mmetsp:Transcript_2740/g.6415  ORF Transcript_2740/g.6415 Transcript_2740/m.6415 type:complete len:272 (+) Transcript_2740:54-869(+)
MSAPPCCPEGALPLLQQVDYAAKGTWMSIGNLQCYVVQGASAPRAALLVYSDIFGPRSGRHCQICDALAKDLDILVVMPDLFGENLAIRNDGFGIGLVTIGKFLCSMCTGRMKKWFNQHSWDNKVCSDTMDTLVPWMKSQGASKLATLGFCYGQIMGFHASATGQFRCGASFHPSLGKVQELDGLQMCRSIKCKQFVMATKDEPTDWYPDNAAHHACNSSPAGDGHVWLLSQKNHGYMSRGDVTRDPSLKEALEQGYEALKNFLQENLIGG